MTGVAPVVVFAYNRADHIYRLLLSLSENYLAEISKVFVYIDGPKREGDVAAVNNVFDVVNNFSEKFGEFNVYKSDHNRGLAKLIISGVGDIVNKYGRVIVLEDDLVLSKEFLVFMNKCLVEYENDERVMHISGYSYPVNNDVADDVFFLRVPMCWGWATWRRAWQKFKKDENIFLSKHERNYIDFDGMHNYSKQLDLNISGKINTWFIYWYISCVRNSGLSVFPNKTLVRNGGFDASGTHGVSVDLYNSEFMTKAPVQINRNVLETEKIIFAHKKYFYNISGVKSKIINAFKLFWSCRREYF
ncbi:hypothetical protein ACU6VG_06075 [Sphaerotilus sulfidivorans]